MQSIYELCIRVCVCVCMRLCAWWFCIYSRLLHKALLRFIYEYIVHCSHLYSSVSFFGYSRFLQINLKFVWTKWADRIYIHGWHCIYFKRAQTKYGYWEARQFFSNTHFFLSYYTYSLWYTSSSSFYLSIYPSFHLVLCIRATFKNENKNLQWALIFQHFLRAINRWPKKKYHIEWTFSLALE